MCDMQELLNISKVLTFDYLNEKLTTWFGQQVELMKYEFGEGTGKGDSLLSELFRITFFAKKLESGNENDIVSIRVILKCLPKSNASKLTFRSRDFFKNEINFYMYVLPILLKFQSEKNVSNPFDNYPKVFAAFTNGEDDVLLLEDLSCYNYRLTVRQEGVDYNHVMIMLTTLAKFHALSFAFKDQNPKQFSEIQTKIFETWTDDKLWYWYKSFWKRLCICAIDAVEKEYPNTIYHEKIKEFAADKTYFRCAAAATENGKTAVFSHGDCWIPNFLIKYSTDTMVPINVKMIDFQLCRCASPILDVAVIIFAGTTRELRTEYYDSMLDEYYKTLSKQILDLGSNPDEIYPKELFLEEVNKYSFFGIAFSMESTPIMTLKPEDAFDMSVVKEDEVMDIGDIWTVKPIKTKKDRLRLCGNIIDAVDKGFI